WGYYSKDSATMVQCNNGSFATAPFSRASCLLLHCSIVALFYCCTENSSSASVASVDLHVVVAEVACPVRPRRGADAAVEADGHVLGLHAFRHVVFVHGKRQAVFKDAHAAELEGEFFHDELRAGIARRGHDAAPVGVTAEEGGLDQRRIRYRTTHGLGIGLAGGAHDLDGDE